MELIFHFQRALTLALVLLHSGVQCLPQQTGGESPADRANKIPQGIMPAKDGSIILDTTETIK